MIEIPKALWIMCFITTIATYSAMIGAFFGTIFLKIRKIITAKKEKNNDTSKN